MSNDKIHGIKEKMEKKVDAKHKGCLHTMLFKVVCGIVAIFLLFALYNIIVLTDKAPATLTEQEEEATRKALLDTFDIVGDYFFPNQKADMEDLLTDEEREAAKKEGKTGDDEKTMAQEVIEPSMESEIIESADVSSDAPPVAEPQQTPAPTVEKLESPTVTPIE